MEWINELSADEIAALLDKDVAIVYQECGIEVLLALWDKLSGINIYVSERPFYNLKRFYIRKKALLPDFDYKKVAVKLKVSEKFVQESLSVTDEDDPRQGKLL